MKVYKDGVEVVSLWQYDKNIALQFGGLDTTLQTQIQFGHGNDKTPAVTPTIETVGGEQRFVATVPNKLLEDGWDLLCYAYQSQGDSGWTETMVKIPVNERMPSREWIPADDPGYIDLQDMRDDIDTLQAEMPLKEDVANKVTALNADVTDTQYPSAKAVFDNDELLAQSLTDLAESLPENYLSTDPGAVRTPNLADGAVTSAKLNNGAVSSEKLGTSAVTNTKLADGAVNAAKIANDSVYEAHIHSAAVTTAKIADGAVTTDKLGSAAVNGAKIADDSVYEQHLHTGAVTTAKIADSSVTNAKLAAGAVRGNNIVDDSVYAQHIHTGAVETAKIADLAVTTRKLANGAVTSAILANGAVETANITNGAVTAAKLATAVSNVLNGAEQTTNKVTSVSSASTDTQYPSAKCVYDYGQSIKTAIEGDLDLAIAALGYVTP